MCAARRRFGRYRRRSWRGVNEPRRERRSRQTNFLRRRPAQRAAFDVRAVRARVEYVRIRVTKFVGETQSDRSLPVRRRARSLRARARASPRTTRNNSEAKASPRVTEKTIAFIFTSARLRATDSGRPAARARAPINFFTAISALSIINTNTHTRRVISESQLSSSISARGGGGAEGDAAI